MNTLTVNTKKMKTATELLEALENFKVFSTTKGTTGDAAGLLKVEKDTIEFFEFADVCTLAELKEINERAYEDCADYWTNSHEFEGWNEEDFFVIYQDCEYILVWEQE